MAKKKSTYELIKKQNGETFAQAIRETDESIFYIPNIVSIVKYAGKKAEPIIPFLISLKQIDFNEIETGKTPFELLAEAGYTSFVADTLEKQNSIRHYFQQDEELCTFNDKHRFENYYIIHAVKHNAHLLKRKNFAHPDRQDEYGTSVISIQLLKRGGLIKITNRYNHQVENQDSTFDNNPDNIIEGLSYALRDYFQVDFATRLTGVPNGYILVNNCPIKYNSEINNVYFGDSFYVKDSTITDINPDFQYTLNNCFILDLKEKKVLNPANIDDCFAEVLTAELTGKKLKFVKTENNTQQLYADNIQILEIKDGYITNIYLPHTTHIGDNFLSTDTHVQNFSAPKVRTVGNRFLASRTQMNSCSLYNVRVIGNQFLYKMNGFKDISYPNVQIIGSDFMPNNTKGKTLYLPNVRIIKDNFLQNNDTVINGYFPYLQQIGNNFMPYNYQAKKMYIPEVKIIGNNFLAMGVQLIEIYTAELACIGHNALRDSENISKFYAPKLSQTGNNFLISHPQRDTLLKNREISFKPTVKEPKQSNNLILFHTQNTPEM
ncbi:MAG: hypothetical protein IKJ28_03570 [Alphaproteobacteria bacterium]|nr:hypothetical protein [Alphaproteobacteria bacterium]